MLQWLVDTIGKKLAVELHRRMVNDAVLFDVIQLLKAIIEDLQWKIEADEFELE